MEAKWLAVSPTRGIPEPDPSAKSLVRSIEAPDESTVKIYLERPDVAFDQKFAFLRPADIEKYGYGIDLFKNPVGTGPFVLQAFMPDDHVTLARNENYWGDKANLSTLVFPVIKETTSRLLELQAGTMNGIDNFAPHDFPSASDFVQHNR